MIVEDIFGERGLFAQQLDDFTYRQVQQQMAMQVEQTIDAAHCLVVEAATGVGKTYAYSVPAILSGGKTIISTGSRHLQDQLYLKDLPLVKQLLGVNAHICLLKGRSNYLCKHRLQQFEQRLGSYHGEVIEQFHQVKSWAQVTESGDISEVAELNEDAMIWSFVTSNADQCSSQTCTPSTCFVMRARREAQEADIVVVNHHLFFADLALKDEGFGEILPSANTFILDEAHQLPEIASRFFGRSLSSRQLLELSRDTIAVASVDAADTPDIKETARQLETAVRKFRLSVGTVDARKAWSELCEVTSIKDSFTVMQQSLAALQNLLHVHAERSEALENLANRAQQFLQQADNFLKQATDVIQWLETRGNGFLLHETPFDIAPIFKEHMQRYQAAWVFTSATLSIKQSFEHYMQQMGIEETDTLLLESPFDFANNAKLFLPKDLPLPNDASHTEKLVATVFPFIELLNGKTFFLFTSFRALHKAASLLMNDYFIERNYHLYIQGEAPRIELIKKFKQAVHQDKGAILLATSGFWEGVDIKGEALQLVVIDKLPFASPDDPVLQARFKILESQSMNPFSTFQVPKAVISLKQGVGRLIRSYHDQGMVVIGDTRLVNKFYGKLFLQSLPALPKTQSFDEAQSFLARL